MLFSGVIFSLSACSPPSSSSAGGTFPEDAQIVSALDAQLVSDPNSTAARELIQTLGGEKGKLKYEIKQVIYRQGAWEVHYDAALVMGQSGAESLKALYASMIADSDRASLSPPTLETYEGWLKNHALALGKDTASKAEGQALTHTVALLENCYKDAKAGSEISVMQGLGALISPERKGLYAEKLPMAGTTVRCLPL